MLFERLFSFFNMLVQITLKFENKPKIWYNLYIVKDDYNEDSRNQR